MFEQEIRKFTEILDRTEGRDELLMACMKVVIPGLLDIIRRQNGMPPFKPDQNGGAE